MLIYHAEVDLGAGFEILRQPNKEHRLVRGRKVSRCSGFELFRTLYDEDRPLKCWCCNRVGSLFVVNKGRNDKLGSPTLDLFSNDGGVMMLMTRDHIIPRSLGGGDMVENLRIGCSECNGARGNTLDEADRQFMGDHPELIVRLPNPVVPQSPMKTEAERTAMKRAKRKRALRAKRDREVVTAVIKKTGYPPLTTMTALAILGGIA